MLLTIVHRLFASLLKKARRRWELREGESWFVQRGRDPQEKHARAELAAAFRRVQRHVKCAHSSLEALQMADFLLSAALPGPIVECGCYKGGATAKLSWVARTTGRRLLVCDSFEGLPQPAPEDRGLLGLHQQPYARGMYSGALAEVQQNLADYGAAEVCEYYKGYFHTTLLDLPAHELSCAFIDVDLVSSARDCLRALWPRLTNGGRIYLHEARDLRFIHGVTEAAWWQRELGLSPPLLIGAGFGCGAGAPQLAYFDKPVASSEIVGPENALCRLGSL